MGGIRLPLAILVFTSLTIVDDLDPFRGAVAPDEADSPSIVDPDTVPTLPAAAQSLEPIATSSVRELTVQFRCPAWRRRSLLVVCAPYSNSAGHEKRWPAPQRICCTVISWTLHQRNASFARGSACPTLRYNN